MLSSEAADELVVRAVSKWQGVGANDHVALSAATTSTNPEFLLCSLLLTLYVQALQTHTNTDCKTCCILAISDRFAIRSQNWRLSFLNVLYHPFVSVVDTLSPRLCLRRVCATPELQITANV